MVSGVLDVPIGLQYSLQQKQQDIFITAADVKWGHQAVDWTMGHFRRWFKFEVSYR